MAGAWPTADDLKQRVDVEGTDDWNVDLESAMQAGIDRVKDDVGSWDDDVDEPDDSLYQASLRAAVLLRANGESAELEKDPQYRGYLRGHRREFGIA